jgi:hypothetical protein
MATITPARIRSWLRLPRKKKENISSPPVFTNSAYRLKRANLPPSILTKHSAGDPPHGQKIASSWPKDRAPKIGLDCPEDNWKTAHAKP